MHVPTLETLMQRLECVERENRRLRRWGSLLLLGVAGLVLMGQVPAGRVVEAERFVLREAGGKIRAELGTRPDGQVALRLLDRDGKARAELRVLADDRVGLLLSDKGEKARAALRVLTDGSPVLGLFDKDGKLFWQAP